MIGKCRLFIYVLLSILVQPSGSLGQSYNEDNLPYIHILGRHLHLSEVFHPGKLPQEPHSLTENGWAAMIDYTWGPGLPTDEKLELFDAVCDSIDRGYGAFVNYDVNIDSLRNLYRPEIEAGVSRGRFAAIMNYISLALRELHTFVMDIQVNYGTYPSPGIPLFVVGTATEITRFGAGLTPLEDGSLLVYKVAGYHTLHLRPGDVILGYNGIPWSVLYQQLIDYQLPIKHNWWGSTNESMEHIMLQSAGLNWHLFDTIDVIRYNTGDTVHLSTQRLEMQTSYSRLWGNEQISIPGVPMPNFLSGNFKDYISYGIVEGTDIGYIYVGSWHWYSQYQISEQWYNAISDLMFNHETDGLIVDFRLNYGGYMLEAHDGYSLLFNSEISNVAYDIRGDPNTHLDMVPHPFFTASLFTIPGNPSTYYNKPIAVLTGPNAVSNGDWESLRLGFHPMARVFGKGTNGAFTSSAIIDLGHSNWIFQRGTGSGYLVDGHEYIAHVSAPIDEEVWLTREDVANGDDTVVKAAIDWINSTVDVKYIPEGNHFSYILKQNYPNPFNPTTLIKFHIPELSFVTLKVYDVLGKEIATLVNEEKPIGSYEVEFSAKGGSTSGGDAYNLSSGIYFYLLQAGDFVETKKMVLMK